MSAQIFVLDSLPRSLRVVEGCLRALGYTWIVLADRDRYKIEMRAAPPALLLVSADAFDGTAFELARDHYHEAKTPVPVVAWSSRLSQDQLKHALPIELRVGAILSSPLDPAEFARVITMRVPAVDPVRAQAVVQDLTEETAVQGPRLEAPEGTWDLRQHGLARLLAGATTSRWSGRLVVDTQAARRIFWFTQGTMVHAAAAEGRELLVTMVAAGRVPAGGLPDVVTKTVEEQLGLLFSLRLLGLHEGEKLQSDTRVRLVADVLFAEAGQAVGTTGEPAPDRLAMAKPALAVAIAAARSLGAASPQRVLDGHPESVVVVRLPAREVVTTWGLGPEERRMTDALEKARGRDVLLDQFLRVVSTDGASRVDARSVLALLRGIGLIDFRGRPWDQETDDLLEKLVVEIHRVSRGNVFESLGLDMNTTDNDIRERMRALAKAWHPDNFYDKHPRVQKGADALFARIQAAYDQIKTGPGRGAARAALVGGPSGGVEKAKDPNQARVALSQAKLYLRNKRYEDARMSLRDAVVLDPSNAEAKILFGWARYLSEPSGSAAAVSEIEAGSKLDPKNPDAFYYLGRIASLQKDPDRAQRYFRKAVTLKPDHTDALRELRVLERRKAQPKLGGVEQGLGKALEIFGRKKDGK